MALAEFHFTSKNNLGRQMSAMFIVPEKKTGPFPVLYLLHGMSDDHTAWTRWSNVDKYVENLPLMVVMPDTERGWYVDAARDPGKKFESMIIEDLIGFVDSTFQTVASRAGRAIAGLSMGGYGALSLAMKHPDMFRAAHGFSGGFDRSWQAAPNDEFRLLFGDDPTGTDFDINILAGKLDVATMPSISFDCGIDDFTLEGNRSLHARLTDLGIPHRYTEYPGAHTWAYWNEHILGALPDLLAALEVTEPFDPDAYLPNRNEPIRRFE
jgi:S-formylglutathione hydrolase FrmB